MLQFGIVFFFQNNHMLYLKIRIIFILLFCFSYLTNNPMNTFIKKKKRPPQFQKKILLLYIARVLLKNINKK